MTSKATKRKHVVQQLLEDFPEPTEEQAIVQITAPKGNNLHEALYADGTIALVSMPTKFRKNVWMKRGDFAIVDPIAEGDKVRGEIATVLLADHIKHLQKTNQWPAAFEKARAALKYGDSQSISACSSDATVDQAVTSLSTLTVDGDVAAADVTDDASDDEDSDASSEDGDAALDAMFGGNPNRPPVVYETESSSDSSDNEEE
eukprot:m.360569 g.360569  ORF g.360569 m.360569 type:complete len:203 (+) comp19091_c0_seq1:195-803(+)